MRKMGKILLAVTAALLLVFAAACTPSEQELLQGVLKNVDSVNGEITIVTKDGKTITVNIESDTPIETDEASSNLEALEPGASVEVEVNKGEKTARRVKAKQAEIEGTIIRIEGNIFTIASEKGKEIPLSVISSTRIELDDDSGGTAADLEVGIKVEAKYDPATGTALKIEAKKGNELVSQPGANWGILEIRVTDPPPADVKSAIVHLNNIEVHKVSGNESEWITIIGAPASFDLLDVIGVSEILGSANITAGSFTQIRMDVTSVTGNTTDDVPYSAEVPGDKLKIVRPFNVGGGKTTVLTLDFNGEKSLIRTGNGKYLFKPVVKLLLNEEKPEQVQEQEQTQEQEHNQGQDQTQNQEQEEFEGTIVAIDGDNWTMTIGSENWTVDVSEAEIDGEPAVGLQAEVKGTVEDDTIVASKVKIEEEEEEFEGTIVAINGDNWTMTIEGETWTVNVSEAEIDGEPAVGLQAEVKGTVEGDTIIASEVEIKETA